MSVNKTSEVHRFHACWIFDSHKKKKPRNDEVFKILSIVREVYLNGYSVPEIGPCLFGHSLILKMIFLDLRYFEITELATLKCVWHSRHGYRQNYLK